VIGKSLKPSASRTLNSCQLNTMQTLKHGWRQIFLFVPLFFRCANGGAKHTNYSFVDNCAPHSKDTSFLRNVKVVRYLVNCTSTLQPLDLGIIHS
jgi:hypothetical protein